MKKILVTLAITLSVIMTMSPVAFATSLSNASSGSNDFLYQPYNYAIQLSPNTVLPNAIPFCTAGSGLTLICYDPSYLRSAYNFPSALDGTGQTILIVDAFGSPTIVNDLAFFDQRFSLPPAQFSILCPSGGCPAYDPTDTHHDETGWAVETSLDVEYAHAMAPGANIVLVVASTSSGNAINSAEAQAVKLYPGSIMSQSFGIPEYLVHNNNAQIKQADNNYIAAQAAGITVFASAGDFGATNGGPFANAGFPASDPLVTAVTGTQGNPYIPLGSTTTCAMGATCVAGLASVTGPCGNNGRTFGGPHCAPAGYGGEQVWNEPDFNPGATTGGAPSLVFGVPAFQQGLGLTSRVSADVSYNAALNGGVLVYIGLLGGFFFVGGTSAGSPQWAAIAALADQAAGHALGTLNPAIYKIGNNPTLYAHDFHDITVGNNVMTGTCCGFNAATGWDPASGWGTPNVTNLIPDLVANA
jgi:subtilase family serine protease